MIVTMTRAKIALAFVTIFSLILSSLTVYLNKFEPEKGCIVFDTLNFDIYFFVIVPLAIVVFLIVSVLYAKIGCIACKKQTEDSIMRDQSQSKKQSRTTKLLTFIVGVYSMTNIVFFIIFGAIFTKEIRTEEIIASFGLMIWMVSKTCLLSFLVR